MSQASSCPACLSCPVGHEQNGGKLHSYMYGGPAFPEPSVLAIPSCDPTPTLTSPKHYTPWSHTHLAPHPPGPTPLTPRPTCGPPAQCVRLTNGNEGEQEWEECDNHALQIPSNGVSKVDVEVHWGYHVDVSAEPAPVTEEVRGHAGAWVHGQTMACAWGRVVWVHDVWVRVCISREAGVERAWVCGRGRQGEGGAQLARHACPCLRRGALLGCRSLLMAKAVLLALGPK